VQNYDVEIVLAKACSQNIYNFISKTTVFQIYYFSSIVVYAILSQDGVFLRKNTRVLLSGYCLSFGGKMPNFKLLPEAWSKN
jgi:hypothetical protein